MEIVSRKDAIRLGFGRYFTGKPCKNGHIDERLVANGTCLTCAKNISAKWAISNSEKKLAKSAEWKRNNPEKASLSRSRWRNSNKERCALYNSEWAKENRDRVYLRLSQWRSENRSKVLGYSSKYQKSNPHKHAARQAKRRGEKLKATPYWADEFLLKEIYEIAKMRTEATGIKWHVDHIVPLKARKVCGLHCEANLRVIIGSENQSKGNRWWPDMP